jgi:hypothetical protein
MILIMFGVLTFAGGVIMFRAAMPGGPARGAVIRSKRLGDLYTTAVMVLVAAGTGMVIYGFIDLAS